MDLPTWFWGGSIPDFFVAARLVISRADDNAGDVMRVQTLERSTRQRPNLVTVMDIAGPTTGAPKFDALTKAEQSIQSSVDPQAIPKRRQIDQHIEQISQRVSAAGAAGSLALGLSLHQLQTLAASASEVAVVVQAIHDDIRDIRFAESDATAFPAARVHFIQRDIALLHRTKLPAVLLRLAHDEQLRTADLSQVVQANSGGTLIFAASSSLADGVILLDAYLAPLFGALSPFIWAFPATRASGTVIYSFGRAIAGTTGEAAEPLQLLPARGPHQPIGAPHLDPRCASATIRWWVRRLDMLLSVVSDPAVFSDTKGRYAPTKHLHALLSIDQLFRRTASIQRAHRDSDARRVLLFTVLDTLERVTSRPLVTMCTLSFAEKTLADLRRDLSPDVGRILLPAAERAVRALAAVQDGFFLQRQFGASNVEFTDADGATKRLEPMVAAAEYIRLLRNATHGHGSNREVHKLRTDALLAHHDGTLPHDLGLLGYLYLLELLTKPDLLRRTLYNGGKT